MKGGGNSIDYGFRMHDPRVGRFLSIDPLSKSFPWFTPYQFSGNSPISCVDLDGLEMYFAADGTFLGQSKHGGSEIRIATSKTTFTNKKGVVNYIIAKSKPLNQFDLATQGKVFQTIYNREIKGKSKVVAVNFSNEPDLGARTPLGVGPIKMNVAHSLYPAGKQKKGLMANNYYYNVVNTEFHEDAHFRGVDDTGFEHFSIWKTQIEHSSFSKVTEGYKQFLNDLANKYLQNEVNEMMGIYSSDNPYFKDLPQQVKDANFEKFYEQYVKDVQFYNKTYGENKEIKSVEYLT